MVAASFMAPEQGLPLVADGDNLKQIKCENVDTIKPPQ
jgi:hypothetical protein